MEQFVDRDELLRRLDREYRRFQSAIAPLTPEQLEAAGVIDAWSIKDLVAHLIVHEQFALREVQYALRGERFVPETHDSTVVNTRAVAEWQHASAAEVLQAWDNSFQQIVAFVRALPDAAFDLDGAVVQLLEDTIDNAFNNNTYEHYAEHLPMVEAWVRRHRHYGAALDTPRGPVIIRPTREQDIYAYREMRLEALRLHPEVFGADLAESQARPIERWQGNVRDGAGTEQNITFVAESGGNLVGMTGIRRFDGVKMQHSAMIWGVYVRPEWRGVGIIDALLETCLDWAASRDVRLVKLSVVATNAPAIRSYVRAGFSVYGLEPDVILAEGTYYDELLMVRHL
jgi:ribosomal protein S18 acetylase RimI-like enzyme